MGDGFFDANPGLGFVFDFDDDGHLDYTEAAVMGTAFAILDEETSDFDDYDDDYDDYGDGGRRRKRTGSSGSSVFDSDYDFDDYDF